MGGGAVTRIRGPSRPSSRVTVPTSGRWQVIDGASVDQGPVAALKIARPPGSVLREDLHMVPADPWGEEANVTVLPPSYGESLCVLPVTWPVVGFWIPDFDAGGIPAGMGAPGDALGDDSDPLIITDRHGSAGPVLRYSMIEAP